MLSFVSKGSTATVNADGLTIIKAMYGVQNTFTDVTKEVQNLAQGGELNFTVSAQSLGILDPAPGVKKNFQMQYRINGGNISLHSKDDGEQVVLSVPNAKLNLAQEDSKKAPTFLGITWQFIAILFTAFFTLSSYVAGTDILGSTAAGVVFAALALGTGGLFGIFWVPLIIFLFFLVYPNYIPLKNQ